MCTKTRILRKTALVALVAAGLSANAQAVTDPCPPTDLGVLWDSCTDPRPWDRRPWEMPRPPCGCIELPF